MNLEAHSDKKTLLDNEVFNIVLYNDIYDSNILYVIVKDTTRDLNLVKRLTKSFLDTLNNVYCAFGKANIRLSIVYDLSRIPEMFPPTILWTVGKFFTKKKEITNKILYCTCVVIHNDAVNKLISTFLKLYDNQRPIHMVSRDTDAFQFIKTEINTYNSLLEEL